jgi:predicted ABC-type ATPase
MESLRSTWANQLWTREAHRIEPIGDLPSDDPRRVDFSKIGPPSNSFKLTQSSEREALRTQIISELVDEWKDKRSSSPKCILTHGGIASGKTSAIDLFLEQSNQNRTKYLHLDFDRVKQLLPEYALMRSLKLKYAAEFTQEESAKIAVKAFTKAIKFGVNLIYEGSLAKIAALNNHRHELKRGGYTITVISTFVTETIGQLRALKRYQSGGRFVPPEVIKETYSKCPGSLLTIKDWVDEIVLIDNRPDQTKSRLILVKASSGEISHLDNKLYDEYIKEVGKPNCIK